MLLVANVASTKRCKKSGKKMIETLAYGYSSESTPCTSDKSCPSKSNSRVNKMSLYVTYQFVLIEESYLVLWLVSGSLGFYGTVILHSDGPAIDGVSLVAVYVRHCEGETLEPGNE